MSKKDEDDEKLFFLAIDEYAKNGPDQKLILASMKALFNNMPDLDIKIGEKND